ncbi:MAG: thiol peroxidase [Gammaproteobacteria bacterium]|nr:thiol peroxidase [Gammaproteobacteria bacterium]
MAQITLKGNPINTSGTLPAVGSQAPDFVLTKTDLSDISLKDLQGKRVILNIFPSIDTEICAASVRHFNADASALENTVVLCISLDLPFAHKRFCGAEGLDKVESVSELRSHDFGGQYGARIIDGPLAGLLSRAVVVLDENGNVTYTQQVPDIVQEPDYEAVLNAVR